MKKHISLAVIAASIAACSSGQTFNSVEELWRYADDHNVSMANARLETLKGKKTISQSYMAFTPSVTANAAATDNTTIQTTLIPAVIFGGPAGTYQAVQFGQKYIYNAGVTAQMDIVNIQTWQNARIARSTAELNRASEQNTRKNIYQQIAAQYYNCILCKEGLRLAKQSADVADSVREAVENKYSTGLVSQPNLDMAKLNSERAQQTYITASYQLASSLNLLKGLLAMSASDSIDVAGYLSEGALSKGDAMFAEDPSVKLQYRQMELNRKRIGVSNASAYPTLSILYSNNSQQFDNTFRPLDASGPKWYPANYWSLRASWNILGGGNRWLQTQKNKLAYLQSKADLEQAQRQSAINDENLRLSYKKAIALLEKSKSIMDLSYDNYEHISMRYNEGIASLEDRLRAFSDYISYQNQYLNSLSEMLVQQYNIKLRQQTF